MSFDPNAGAVLRNPLQVHQLDLGHALLQHRHARLDEALPLLGRGVLRVLAQIAQLARALNLLWQLVRELALEHADLVFESLDEPCFHRRRLRLT